MKSLLLGAAAGFVGFAAQAADLPGKAAPASYVKICDTYGAGFYYIPGSNTCLKIGGFVRQHIYAGQTYNGAGSAIEYRTRFLLSFDARSQTEYGLLRGFGSFFVQRGAAGVTAPSGNPTGGTGQGGANDATLVALASAFVQFGPLTAGYAPSFFNFYQNDHNYVDNGGASFRATDTATNLLAFTGSFGGGFMATISIEDRSFREIGALRNGVATGGATVGAFNNNNTQAIYAGQGIPDIVAALRVEQGWGAVQVMGALHEVRVYDVAASANTTIAGTEAVLSRWGWAAGAGVRLDLNQFARGDQFFLQGVYTQGAVSYAAQQTDSDGLPQTRNALAVGGTALPYADGYRTAAGTVDLSTAWAVWASFRHFWTPSVRTALWGGYVNMDAPATAAATARDGQFWVVGLTNTWSPVRDLDVGLELGYRSLNVQDATGAAVANPSETNWFATMRIQRNF